METKKLIESGQSSNEIVTSLTERLKVQDFDQSDYRTWAGAGDFPDGTKPQIAEVEPNNIDWDTFGMSLEDPKWAGGTFVLGYDKPSGKVALDFILNSGGSGPEAEEGYVGTPRSLDDGLKKLYSLITPITKRQLISIGFSQGY